MTMRPAEPSLPSISSVLSFAQRQEAMRPPHPRAPPHTLRRQSSRATCAHPPRYPPQLDSDFLMKTVDRRFERPPAVLTRSSFALPDIFEEDDECEFEIVKSPTTSERSSSWSTRASLASTSRKARAICTYIQCALDALRGRWRRVHPVTKAENRLHFDLCN